MRADMAIYLRYCDNGSVTHHDQGNDMGHFQTSLVEIGLLPGKVTKRAEFFGRLDRLVPWDGWVSLVDAHRDERVGAGRRPVATETMLCMLVVQRCLNLSDEECEDQCTDSRALSAFLGSAKVPDKTTLCKSGNWLAAEGVEREIFEDLARQLQAEGLMMREGSVVDAAFVESPSSTKNREHARDPEAHQARSGEGAEFREHATSQAGSVVEHPFHYLKDVMGMRRTRCRGREKNDHMLCMCFALANLLMFGR